MEKPQGYVVPVYRSLSEPILMGGVPRAIAILNGTLAAAIGLGLRLWVAGIVTWMVLQAASLWMTRQDDQFLPIAMRHLKYGEHLSC